MGAWKSYSDLKREEVEVDEVTKTFKNLLFLIFLTCSM